MVIQLKDYRESFIAIVDEKDPQGLNALVMPTAAFKDNPRRFLTSPGQRVYGVVMRNHALAAIELCKLFHTQITDFVHADPQDAEDLLAFMMTWVNGTTDLKRLFPDIDFDVTVQTEALPASA